MPSRKQRRPIDRRDGSGRPFVALASGTEFIAIDRDLPRLTKALARVGIDSEVVAWDAAADWGDYDGVAIRSTWDYVDRLDEFLAWADSVPRLANSASIIRWNANKRYLAELAARGIPVVRTVWPRDGEEIPRDWSDVVVKPAVSAGGRLTGRFSTVADANDFARTLLDDGHDVLVQPYVSSVDRVGESAVYFFGGTVSHAISKGAILERDAAPRPDASLAHGQAYGPLALDDAPVAFATSVLEAIDGPLLYARVDCVRDDDGNDLVIEVELVEPALFLDTALHAAENFADAVLAWVDGPIR